jgi:hypothetical protein
MRRSPDPLAHVFGRNSLALFARTHFVFSAFRPFVFVFGRFMAARRGGNPAQAESRQHKRNRCQFKEIGVSSGLRLRGGAGGVKVPPWGVNFDSLRMASFITRSIAGTIEGQKSCQDPFSLDTGLS